MNVQRVGLRGGSSMNQAGPEVGAQEQRVVFEGAFSCCQNSSVVEEDEEHQQEQH